MVRLLGAAVAALAIVGLSVPAGAISKTTGAGSSWGVPTAIPGLAALLTADDEAWIEAPQLLCAAPGDCTYFAYDVSYATDPSTVKHLLYAVEHNGVWGDASVVPGTASFSFPDGEVCPVQGDCVVWFDTATGQAEIVTETASAWSAPQHLSEPGSSQLIIDSLVCPASGDCSAVALDGTDRVVVVTEQHGSWLSPVVLPGVAALEGPHVTPQTAQVVCAAVGTCVLTGELQNQVTYDEWPFVAEERAGVWSDAHTIPWVMARNRNQAVIDDAACGAPGWCTLVGSYENGIQSGSPSIGYGPQYVGFAQSEEDGVWLRPVTLTAASFVESGSVEALVACPDRASCTVTGLEGQHTDAAFVQHLVNGVPRGRATYELYGGGKPEEVTIGGLSCPSAGACGLLLGGYNGHAAYQARGRLVVANELNGAWSKPKGLAGYPGFSGLGGPADASVACSRPTRCAAATDLSPTSEQPPGYYLTS